MFELINILNHRLHFSYTTLHYTTLHYTTLHYTTLHYTTLHYTTLHYTTPHYNYYTHTHIYMRNNYYRYTWISTLVTYTLGGRRIHDIFSRNKTTVSVIVRCHQLGCCQTNGFMLSFPPRAWDYIMWMGLKPSQAHFQCDVIGKNKNVAFQSRVRRCIHGTFEEQKHHFQ